MNSRAERTFLEEVAQYIYDQNPSDLRSTLVVVPGHRSAVFLKKHLALCHQKAYWPPRFVTISELFQEMSPHSLIAPEETPFLLFNSYRKLGPDHEPFDAFWKWGKNALADFNDIDNYLVDGKVLFSNLREIKDIEEWSLSGENLSREQEHFLQFWDDLGHLYDQFRRDSLERGKLLAGTLKRDVLDNEHYTEFPTQWEHIHLVGFNALSPSEELLFRHLTEHPNTTVHWDADQHYVGNAIHEAGLFLRRLSKHFTGIQEVPARLAKSLPEITLYECAGTTGMSKMAAQLADRSQDNSIRSAIVLCDNNLLTPTLSALPPELDRVNVTMGYPSHTNAVFQCFAALIELADVCRNNDGMMPYAQLSRLLQNAVFQLHAAEDGDAAQTQASLIKAKASVVDLELWTSCHSDATIEKELERLFHLNSVDDLLQFLVDMCGLFRAANILDSWNREFLFHISSSIRELSQLVNIYGVIEQFRTVRDMFYGLIGKEELSFVGEPLDGLQIMGMLETRTLDFDHVILVSANEGFLPAKPASNSFIPFDLRKAFKLPTHHDRESIYSYYFYRLLHRSERVDILYSAQRDILGSGERSHFIEQLRVDFGMNAEAIYVQNTSFDSVPSDVVLGAKDSIRERLIKSMERSLSPSRINSFFDCPLNFVIQNAFGLGEPEELEDNITVSEMGTVIHQVLFDLYEPFIHKKLTEDELRNQIPLITERVDYHFAKALRSNKNLDRGLNFLANKMSADQVRKVIAWDIAQIKAGNRIEIVALEKKYEHSLPVDTGEFQFNARLAGEIDRIDRVNGQLRIVDYKTGTSSTSRAQLKSTAELTNKIKDHARQLLYYAYIFSQDTGNKDVLTAGIASTRALSGGLVELTIDYSPFITAEHLSSFEEELHGIIAMILDPEQEYMHNPKSKYCKYCVG
ncbi:MAG: PD-(D/E)XK nuclease family protein [Flavobacteriales bacterium]|nr:PD-(D/E)XK nuclease family protein [Flavobacteriales bacterium]